LQRAVAIDPRRVDAHGYLGLIAACEGHADESQEHVDRIRAMDPLSAFSHFLAAISLNASGRFLSAEAAARRVLELQADSLTGLWPLGVALCGLSQHDEAVTILERAVLLSRAPYYVGLLGLAYGRAGRAGDARRLVDELHDRSDRGEYIVPLALLCLSVGLDEADAIRAKLEACLTDATPAGSIRITCGPLLDGYRHHPEIARLLNRICGPVAPAAGQSP
jgi:tetratricopeptide (TPR) repeat protein